MDKGWWFILTYADPEIVKDRLGSLYKSSDGPGEITDAMVTLAVNDADITIKSELRDEGITPPLDTADDIDELHSAANLFALSDLLDTAYEGTDGERPASAVTRETQAYRKLNKYINRPKTEEEETGPRIRCFVAGND